MANAVTAAGAPPVVETRGPTKRFGDLTALDGRATPVPAHGATVKEASP